MSSSRTLTCKMNGLYNLPDDLALNSLNAKAHETRALANAAQRECRDGVHKGVTVRQRLNKKLEAAMKESDKAVDKLQKYQAQHVQRDNYLYVGQGMGEYDDERQGIPATPSVGLLAISAIEVSQARNQLRNQRNCYAHPSQLDRSDDAKRTAGMALKNVLQRFKQGHKEVWTGLDRGDYIVVCYIASHWAVHLNATSVRDLADKMCPEGASGLSIGIL